MDEFERIYALGGKWLGGARSLDGQALVKKRFKWLRFGPADPLSGNTLDVSDCSFLDCDSGGEFAISHGVRVRSVIFDGMKASACMLVSSASIFDNMVVRGGRKSAGLWCKPPYHGDNKGDLVEWARNGMADVKVAIDFSGLAAPDVEVVGIPLSKLHWNPELHVPVSKTWEKADGWADLELPANSFWRLLLQRLDDFGSDEGVFSIPLPGDRNYERKMEELARIEEAGILRR